MTDRGGPQPSDEDSGDQRADGAENLGKREPGRALVELELRHRGNCCLEVVRHRAGHEQHDQRGPDDRHASCVLEALPKLTFEARALPTGEHGSPIEPEKRTDHHDVRDRIYEEARARTDCRDQYTGNGRTDEARQGGQERVQGDSIGELARARELIEERLRRGSLERPHHPESEGEDADPDDRDAMRNDHRSQTRGTAH